MIAVVLMAIFTVTTGALVAQGTRASADNRARIGAAGLAQRELELAQTAITESPEGVESLFSPQTAVNPNVAAELESGDAEFAFIVDGQRYRVERYTQRQAIGAGSPCETAAASPLKQFAALVRVTVTWEGMSPGTRPHVASALFPPHRGVNGEATGDRAVISAKVTGVKDPATTARANMRVRVTGPGANLFGETDSRGCVVFAVEPPASGGDYQLTLLGPASGAAHVNLGGAQEEVWTEYAVMPGESRNHEFGDYELAASLTVTVVGADSSVTEVELTPFTAGAGISITAPLEPGGVAKFPLLSPSTYAVSAGTATPVSVTLAPGDNGFETLVIP
jgi:hypothetical protein